MTILEDQPTSISGRLDALVRDVLIDRGYPDRTEVTIHTVDVDTIAERNREAFGKHHPTDVVSFPVEDLSPGAVPAVDDDGPPLVLGDVFIAPAIVSERAIQHGFDPDSELALMAVHGVLHLLGYDHVDDADAEAMETIETRVLAQNGYTRR